jgi:di/tricarboxylate transporter
LTLHQIEAFAIVAGMLALFVSDRLRYDVVGALALSAAILTGVVPAEHAFGGFSNPVIIIIASVLVISRAIAISGVVEAVMLPLLRWFRSTTMQVGVLTAAVTFLSAFMKNVGALSVFLPIAVQTAERSEQPVSRYLLPLSFGSLIGGTITQIGTSPNLLISTVRQQTIGKPYHLFDYAPVGLPLSVLAIALLSLAWRLTPRREGRASQEKRIALEEYMSEARLPPESPLIGKTVADLEALGEGEVTVFAIIREHDRRYIPAAHWVLFEHDVLVLQADPVTLKPILDRARLQLLGSAEMAGTKPRDKDDELEVVEAVVLADSQLLGRTPQEMRLRQQFEVNLLAISRSGRRVSTRLRQTPFHVGDIVMLQGRRSLLAETLTRLGCISLAERNLAIARPRARYWPAIILIVAMALVSLGILQVEVGFFISATIIMLTGLITPRETYDAIDWPIIVMLGCLIPVGESLRDTGATGLIASGLSHLAAQLPGPFAVGLILVASMLITPFLHHAAAVLVMGPVAAAVAHDLGFGPDAFLMAVALGASCDFLTPIGHQNNTLVMGPGGYRFSDYWRLGLPLSCMVATVGTWLIIYTWPLHP